MTGERPLREKLRKVEALSADATATPGEKAAADAAADRLRATGDRLAAARGSGSAKPEPGIMYLLGRATRRLLSKLK
jgi:hypothetical protein